MATLHITSNGRVLDKLTQRLGEYARRASFKVQAGYWDHGFRYPVDEGALPGSVPKNVPTVAYENEYGGINDFGKWTPARPFMRGTIAIYQQQWVTAIAAGLSSGAGGQRVANEVGQLMVSDIQTTIKESHQLFVPNAAVTVAKKGNDQPLIGRYHMLYNTVEYKVQS